MAWGVDGDNMVIGRDLAMIAVRVSNPAHVSGVDAFASDSSLETATCSANSPFGNFAALVVGFGGVQPAPSRVAEGCDTDAVARVARGELNGAFAVRTFLQITNEVQVVNVPDNRNSPIDIRYAPATSDPSSESIQCSRVGRRRAESSSSGMPCHSCRD